MSVGTILYTLFISPLKLLFEVIFSYANKVTQHPGLSIIVLSLAINLLVLPLYRRSDAMQEEERLMQAKLQKGVSHIKKVFKGDERMLILQTYYRQNNYKPTYVLRGATSLFLEIPFFMAAYSFLSSLAMLSGVSFGPIADLGLPDALLTIGSLKINLLPFLMTLINVISTAIFTKDYPVKTKVQLYGMAAFFLVFLYDSPSGLVFYWTLNNLFSLIKTIICKLRNPKKAVAILASLSGALVFAAGLVYLDGYKRVFVAALALALQLPAAMLLLRRRMAPRPAAAKSAPVPSKRLFLFSALFLAVLTGVLIPSGVIKASPLEFINKTYFYHPLWYIVSSACLSFGTCLIWFSVFYWLASDRGKVLFERVLCALCGVAIVDYLFFGNNLGTMNTLLQFDQNMSFTGAELLVNLLAASATAVLMYVAASRWKKGAPEILMVGFLAITGMSAVNIVSIGQDVGTYLTAQSNSPQDKIEITLSKTGKNVVVLMLDRAASHMFPYIMKENPDLAAQFSGFTYYSNVISFGKHTNYASPALYGGYEYMPVEINKRDTESLCEKQNEALKVMPVLFLNEGYDVTVFDPTYANYQWIPDLSIYNDYPGIKKAITMGMFNGTKSLAGDLSAGAQKLTRNFFCYGVMKSAPVLMQKTLYEDGLYRHLPSTAELADMEGFDSYLPLSFQNAESLHTANGISSDFMDSYTVLTHLGSITRITDDEKGSFLMMSNDTTHANTLLQTPDYIPSYTVDNTAYDAAHEDRFVIDGKKLNLDTISSMEHYHINMAALLQLGKWLDYLRENDVYDNTRIIFVSDHSTVILNNLEELIVPIEGRDPLNITSFFPLLLVKDFDADGPLTEDSSFMTNADVPTLAMDGIIENPINPFTGKEINNKAKSEGLMYINGASDLDPNDNNGNVFRHSPWYSIHDDIRNPDNWAYAGGGILPPGIE